jgi:hypothetical protein
MVRIVSPVNGATLRTGSTIQLAAEAFDYDENLPRPPFTADPAPVVYAASLVRVEFFVDDASIGAANSLGGILYRLAWVVPGQGTYTLRAKATDRDGATTVSGPVEVTVVDAPVVVLRHLPKAYRPGGKVRVRLSVEAASAVTSTIEDKPPAGWVVTRATRGGTYDPVSGTVRFGPFNDDRERIVAYQVEVPPNATGVQQFAGTVTAGGVIFPIGGEQTIGPVGQPRKTGINGLILRPTLLRGSVLAPIPAAVPAANVLIWISDDSTRPAFSVRTDNNGRFQVETMPGTIHINVPALPADESDLSPSYTLPATQPKTVDVKVTENQVVDLIINLAARTTAGEPRLIYTVDEVTLSPSETLGPIAAIHVSAKGTARTSGWSNPQLRVRNTRTDGIVELDFVAVPPDGAVLPVLSPVSATAEVKIPANFRGVQVFAETNSKEALLQPRKTGINGLVVRPTLLRGTALVPIPAEVPAANVTISVSDNSDRPTFSVQTDRDGRFEVETVAGPVTIVVPALPADESATSPSYTLPATEEKTVNVTVAPNQLAEVGIHLTAKTVTGPRPVYTVEEISLGAVDFPPVPTILVTAKGTTRSSGWKNPQLRQRTPIVEGVVELDFVATPSDGMILPVLTPVSATASIQIPAGFRGVRVFAETNSKEILLPQP